jgi:hypothetical protein
MNNYMEKYQILKLKKNKKPIKVEVVSIPETKIIIYNLISDINYNEIYYDTIINFKINYPTFDIEYYKQFNLNPHNLNDLKLMHHYSTIGSISNQKYLEYDYIIDNYINRLDISHPLYSKTQDGDAFRNISTNTELKSYFNSRGKLYYICNKESFYKLYPDFDLSYYKNRYFQNTELSDMDLLKHYHLTGKYEQKATNNKIKIVIYTRPFDILCGGIVALHHLAKIINDIKHPKIYAKLFVYNNLKYNNIFCNQFENVDEINDNTVVIYPEVISGNPLNSKKVVRWILLSLGIEMPINHYIKWGLSSLINSISSDGVNNLIYQWESIQNTIPQLSVPWFNPIFKNINQPRTKTCYLIKKGGLLHNKIKFMHDKNSICIDNMNLAEKSVIFNQCNRFYCYDPNTAYMIFAVSCGCIAILHPLENVSKDEYFKNKIFNRNNKIFNAGIAYGDTYREIAYAEKTLNEGIKMYINLFNDYKNTVMPFLDSIKKLF